MSNPWSKQKIGCGGSGYILLTIDDKSYYCTTISDNRPPDGLLGELTLEIKEISNAIYYPGLYKIITPPAGHKARQVKYYGCNYNQSSGNKILDAIANIGEHYKLGQYITITYEGTRRRLFNKENLYERINVQRG